MRCFMAMISQSIKYWILGVALFTVGLLPAKSEAAMFLLDRLQRAEVGDYIVTAVDHTYTVLIIKEKHEHQISVEEITIPSARLQNPRFRWTGWRNWVETGAPGNTNWVMYTIHDSGQVREYFSYTNNAWVNMSTVDNFLSKLLNLRLIRLPNRDMRRVGPPPAEGQTDNRRYWAPQMTYEGRPIYNIAFEAWRTRWPKDGTDLSGKSITVYVPEDDKRYPSYFPYWLEIQGLFGKAKIRIIDSGRQLCSPRSCPKRCVP